MKASAFQRIIAFICCFTLTASLVPYASVAHAAEASAAPQTQEAAGASADAAAQLGAAGGTADSEDDPEGAAVANEANGVEGSEDAEGSEQADGIADGSEAGAAADDSAEGSREPSSNAPGASVDAGAGANNVANADAAKPAVKLAAQDAFQFVYVDQPLLALGTQQTVAVALKDESATMTQARLVLAKAGSSQTRAIDAVSLAGAAAGFTFSFDDSADFGRYDLATLEYATDKGRFVVDLAAAPVPDAQEGEGFVQTQQGAGSFEVVSPELATVMEESAENAQEDGVSALVINDDGSLEAARSLEDALDAAPVEDQASAPSLEAPAQRAAAVRTLGTRAASPVAPQAASAAEPAAITPQATVAGTRTSYLIVAIDPGHGGSDSGATGYGLLEKDLTLDIANALRSELNTYAGVSAYMTRESDVYVGLQERVNKAAAVGADVFVSVHINSAAATSANGAEVWVPNGSSYNHDAHTVGVALGGKIAAQLKKLKLAIRGETDGVAGVRVRNSENGGTYADGSVADYYSVINGSRKKGFPGIIVEHAFISNLFDSKLLANASTRKKMGQADATGIAQQYNLGKESAAKANALVSVTSYVDGLGWERAVHDGKVSGTEGKGFKMQALSIGLTGAAANAGGVQYRVCINGVWQPWASNGATAGNAGSGAKIEAVQVRLTGGAASKYDIYTQSHAQKKGWMGWAKNGATSGTVNMGLRLEAVKVVVVPKGSAAPGSTSNASQTGSASTGGPSGTGGTGMPPVVTYRTHVQTYGWEPSFKSAGKTSGTVGQGKRLEGIQIKLSNPSGYSGGIRYRTHVQTYGWESTYRTSGQTSGTQGQSKRLEAIQIELTGELAKHYDVYYAVHTQTLGWQGWAKNGAKAGSAGYGYRLEGIQIKIVAKGKPAPNKLGTTYLPFAHPTVSYKTHVQTHGWQNNVHDGSVSGTSGQAKRLEGIQVKLVEQPASGSIEYRTHVQTIGWQGWRANGALSGTSGQSKRLEAICIRLTGDMADKYDVWYRVHAQTFGWMGWTKNGSKAGTAGYAKRLEGIQIKVVRKGSSAPGSQTTPYRATPEAAEAALAIMGKPQTTVNQMVNAYKASGKTYPADVYKSKGAPTLVSFCTILYNQAKEEGVRPEVLFTQAMLETGYLQFGGDVKASQCNFGGIGATGGGAGGATFSSVAVGLRAQAQHLKAYACTEPVVGVCHDPRFQYVSRGCAPEIIDLGGRWAADPDYGTKLYNMLQSLLKQKK